MKLRLLSTIAPPPPGFENRRPERRDVLGGPIGLLLASDAEIDTVAGAWLQRLHGVIVTPGPWASRQLHEYLWHQHVPAAQFDMLADMLMPMLSTIGQLQHEHDESQHRHISLERLRRELDTTHRDYQMVKTKLMAQVDALTEAKTRLGDTAIELRDLNQALEERVRARTLELAEAKEAAEAANAAKTFFLASMSHEVRTPMNGVIGLLDILRHNELNPEYRQLLDTAQDSAHMLLNILDDILDFSKIEAGRLELELIPVSLQQLLERITATLAGSARRKQLEIDCRVDSRLPPWVLADPLRLRQILLNLGSNAIKFTETTALCTGEVHLNLELLSQYEDRIEVMLRVRDSGIGMDEATRLRLFGAFSQGESSTSRRYGGTGLGLAISKRLVDLMGGDIGVESSPDRGSLFWVRLPLQIASTTQTPASERLLVPPPAARPLRLLVVDDNATNRLVATRMLEKLGHQVETLGDGVAALDLLATRHFDLVLMDCQMPAMDGYQATRQLRAREASEGRPHQLVVAMTASVLPEERRHCFEAGMDDFLSKPIQLATIAALLARWSQPAA